MRFSNCFVQNALKWKERGGGEREGGGGEREGGGREEEREREGERERERGKFCIRGTRYYNKYS